MAVKAYKTKTQLDISKILQHVSFTVSMPFQKAGTDNKKGVFGPKQNQDAFRQTQLLKLQDKHLVSSVPDFEHFHPGLGTFTSVDHVTVVVG